MTRKLVNFCLAWTLVLGCWGGVLAAAVCPHVGCETAASAAIPAVAAHIEHDSGDCHDSAGTEDHHRHSESHQGHASGPPARGAHLPESGAMRGAVSPAHDPLCSHCMGRPEAPPSSNYERQYGPAKKGGEDAAPHAPVYILAPAAAYVRQIAPAQHAPPGSSDRHLLINVFRI